MTRAIPATLKKLREARFFMLKLQNHGCDSEPQSAEEIEFYLSAFLAAARSVTNVLAAEQPQPYLQWSPNWRKARSERERLLLQRFVDARNRALKRETPSVREDGSATEGSSNLLPPELIFFFSEEGQTLPGVRVLKCRLRPNDPEEEVIPLCVEYEKLLTQLVQDFMAS